MSVQYHVYANTGAGDPVDYTTVIATTASLTWTSSALPYPSDWTFAIRAWDTVSGFSEQNVDCRVRLILDASGADVTARPNAPANVSAVATAGGGVELYWTYSPLGQNGPPTGFLCYITAGTSPGYGGTPLSIPYGVGRSGYSAAFSGLSDGVAYTASVRATNAVATEPNVTAYATFVADASPPTVVDGLTATVGAVGP